MFCGFDFEISTVVRDCQEWLDSSPDTELEHIETQRSSIQRMIDLSVDLPSEDLASLQEAEKYLYEYLVANGAVSSPVLNDDALGGDLVNINWSGSSLS